MNKLIKEMLTIVLTSEISSDKRAERFLFCDALLLAVSIQHVIVYAQTSYIHPFLFLIAHTVPKLLLTSF